MLAEKSKASLWIRRFYPEIGRLSAKIGQPKLLTGVYICEELMTTHDVRCSKDRR
jgi:hypothetical protein